MKVGSKTTREVQKGYFWAEVRREIEMRKEDVETLKLCVFLFCCQHQRVKFIVEHTYSTYLKVGL